MVQPVSDDIDWHQGFVDPGGIELVDDDSDVIDVSDWDGLELSGPDDEDASPPHPMLSPMSDSFKKQCAKFDTSGGNRFTVNHNDYEVRGEVKSDRVHINWMQSKQAGKSHSANNGATGKMLAAVLLGVAEMEQETRRVRQAAGIAAAKERGTYKGRQRATTKAKPARARELREKGLTIEEIATALDVSPRTVFRYFTTMC